MNERRDDIPVLVNYFLELICNDQGLPLKTIKNDALLLLQEINWTGNIRELRNIIERLIILSGNEITAKDVKTYTNIHN